MTTPEDFMRGGGAPAAKWPKVGDRVRGTILDFRMADQTFMETGERKFWDETVQRVVKESEATPGSEVMKQLNVTLQCEATGFTYGGIGSTKRVPIPNDDGKRRIYVRAALRAAIIKAIEDAGGKMEVGALVDIERTPDMPSRNKALQDIHQYKATWTPAGQNPDAVSMMLSKPEPGETPQAAPAPVADDSDPWADPAE